MPMWIEHIDAIARKLQRDVLFIEFKAPNQDSEVRAMRALNWEALPIRQQVIEWLDTMGIHWKCCGHFANTSFMAAYRGQIYIDVPFEKHNEQFKALSDFLENPDGSTRFLDCTPYVCSLDLAMKNADHDTPGFWERCAETL